MPADVLVGGGPAAGALGEGVPDAFDGRPRLAERRLAVLGREAEIHLGVPAFALDAPPLHVRGELPGLPGPQLPVLQGRQGQPLALADPLDGRRGLGLPDEEGAAAVGGHLDPGRSVGGRDGGEVRGGLQDGDAVRVDPGAGAAGPGDPAGRALGVADQLPRDRPADHLGVLRRPAESLRLLLAPVALASVDDRLRGLGPFGPFRGLNGRGDVLVGLGRGLGRFGRCRGLLGRLDLLVDLDRGGLPDALAGAVADRGVNATADVANGHGEGEAAQLGRLLDPVGVRGDDLLGGAVEQDHVRVAALAADVVTGDAEVLAAALLQAEGAQGAGDGDGRGAGGGDEHGGCSFRGLGAAPGGAPPSSALHEQSMRTQ
ncbi:hypothetical protein [Streptomyces variegatus]|uniref:hypothetical protein n=1 Tax=Streptomyces variegatus TaxID=284040 RepID=UPI003C30450C